jgi:putative hydrolase of HD superfamily
MTPQNLMDILAVLEKLKCNTRHSYTSNGRQESVADHCWRLAVMAMLLRPEFPGLDHDKLLKLCLIHDWGEALTGDIPVFDKTTKHDAIEQTAILRIVDMLPTALQPEYRALFAELSALETPESRLCHALDKLEGVLQHNEGGFDSWDSHEHVFNLTYAADESQWFDFTARLRQQIRKDTRDILRQNGVEPAL